MCWPLTATADDTVPDAGAMQSEIELEFLGFAIINDRMQMIFAMSKTRYAEAPISIEVLTSTRLFGLPNITWTQ